MKTDIKVTFEQADLCTFIEALLAQQGRRPLEPIVIRRKPTKSRSDAEYYVTVACEEAPKLDVCPLCEKAIVTETFTPAPALPEPAPSPNVTTLPVTKPRTPKGKPVVLDEELGESLEPPFPMGAAAPTVETEDGGGGGMSSILAQSKALNERKLREQESRRFNKPRKDR